MASIVNSGLTSARNDLAELFDTLQRQRTTLIDQVRTFALTARPLFQLEAERLKAKLGADDPRVQALARRACSRNCRTARQSCCRMTAAIRLSRSTAI